ncbi:MAG: dual specificity protein phosphatase family protein [Planctomycetaceae bacterium]|jgi:hypothetical protein|nr:dual specificity protein phosphatase family protein [Planctomycetaceae bacterium]MBT6487121.1 dual specificity protein phosphatase family protein [Planctomycetaceae bacterium]MBT6496953.1 dual specificity protein phosphatase family protein [Planctomycetaceae bacterium]
MHEIIPSRLWIGNVGDARDVRSVLNLGVEAVVDLACNELPIEVPRDIVYLRFPIVDGTGNSSKLLRLAIETTASIIKDRTPTLVFCSAGLSRSPAVVAAALAVAEEIGLDETLKKIGLLVAHDVLPGLWNDIKAVCPPLGN